jgi:lipopolysaccharide transport system permease protein
MRDAAWIEAHPPRGLLRGFDAREAWRYRGLARMLAVRQLKLRYKQTAFGVGWALLQPLAAVGLLTLVFSRAAVEAPEGMPYALFVLAGFTAWIYVSGAVSLAAMSLVTDRALVTKIYFPRILAPLSCLLPPLADFGVALVLLVAALTLTGTAPGPELALLPVALLVLGAVAAGAGMWLSALNAAYRDVAHALGFLLQAWFLASPVFYATTVVPSGWKRSLLYLNPLSGAIDLFRWTVGAGRAPSAGLAISLATTVVLAGTGLVYFARAQARLADVV